MLTTTQILCAFTALYATLGNALPAQRIPTGAAAHAKRQDPTCGKRLRATGWSSPDYKTGDSLDYSVGVRLFVNGHKACDGIQEVSTFGPVLDNSKPPEYTRSYCLDKQRYGFDPKLAFGATSTELNGQLYDLRVFGYGPATTHDGDSGHWLYQASWSPLYNNGTWAAHSDREHGLKLWVAGADPNHLAVTSFTYNTKTIWSVFYIQNGWLKEFSRDEDGNTVEWKMYGNGFDLGKQASDGNNESNYISKIKELKATSWVNSKKVAFRAVYVLDEQNALHEFTWRSNNPHADLQPSGMVFQNVAHFDVSYVSYGNGESHARLFVKVVGESKVKEFWNKKEIVRDIIPWVEDLDVLSVDVKASIGNLKPISNSGVAVHTESDVTAAFQPSKLDGQGYLSVYYFDNQCNIMQSYRDRAGHWTQDGKTLTISGWD